MAASPDKEDAENTLSNTLERKIIQQQAQAVLDRTANRQSNFAEKITVLSEQEVKLRKEKEEYKRKIHGYKW